MPELLSHPAIRLVAHQKPIGNAVTHEELAKLGIVHQSKLEMRVEASILHVTPEARLAQVEVAKQHVEAVRARYETPVRITLRFLFASIVVLLAFMLALLFMVNWIAVDTTLALAMVVVAGASIAAPLGILLTKIASRMLPPIPDDPASKRQ
jgi:hypothetical protein